VAQPLTLVERYQRALATGSPLVGGHRGNPAEHPENTLASFRSAVELGVDMVECDVHLSADDELVVIHDHTLERTTNGSGLVRTKTLAELREMDAGGGERVPRLAEVCELVRGRVGLCIELKQNPLPYEGLEERLVDELRRQEMLDQTAIVSFLHSAVKRVKELESRLQGGLLEGARPIDPVGMLRGASADIYAPHWGAMDVQLVRDVHAAGGVVGVWTVDDEAALAWCRVCGPDSLFTNRPREILLALRGE
jgi:glycerophosphoryl diester phosphodiesterase